MHLVPATDAQKAERDALTYAEWGSLLTPEAYAAREHRLRAHAWSRADMRTWLLCAEDGAVLASCETFRTRSFLRDADGTRQPGDSFAIASVFTEPHLRGRGHATHLMDLLAAELARRPRAHAALLFSDVGPRLYARSGYLPQPAWDWHLPPSPTPPPDVQALPRASGLGPVLARLRPPDDAFSFWPTPEQLDWHLERGRIYAEQLGRAQPPSLGAARGTDTLVWSFVAKSNTLVVLWFDARSPESAHALLDAARHEAHLAGLERVVLWEEPGLEPLLATHPHARRVARPDALPMVRPLRPEVARALEPTSGLPSSLPSSLLHVPRGLWV
ncbi:GNAT family N-acetyltransferase [Archangium primigenium]|uniref:GNAT family N-acetyltransferase n=1 Tax=[Archangium] primigenium TaxID=2792470 RepID=UPI00195CA74C|nr:GNAT family N-acetyltransferase [Archangium primigenium]MBM7113734.1 N-acetyltransferase [Archangium primigenium]